MVVPVYSIDCRATTARRNCDTSSQARKPSHLSPKPKLARIAPAATPFPTAASSIPLNRRFVRLLLWRGCGSQHRHGCSTQGSRVPLVSLTSQYCPTAFRSSVWKLRSPLLVGARRGRCTTTIEAANVLALARNPSVVPYGHDFCGLGTFRNVSSLVRTLFHERWRRDTTARHDEPHLRQLALRDGQLALLL